VYEFGRFIGHVLGSCHRHFYTRAVRQTGNAGTEESNDVGNRAVVMIQYEHFYFVEQALLQNEKYLGSLFVSAIAEIRAGKIEQGIGKMRLCYNQKSKNRVKEAVDCIDLLKKNLQSALQNNSNLQKRLSSKDDFFWENQQLKGRIRDLNRKILQIETDNTACLADVDWFGGETCP